MIKPQFNGYLGWQVLAASFINATLAAGMTVYAFGLFVEPFEAELGLSREQSNFVLFGSLYISIALWAVLVGRYFDKISARWFAFTGAGAIAAGLGLLTMATSGVLICIIIIGFIGYGLTAAGPFAANALTTRWFYRRRGRALGIATVATSAGGFLVVPLFSYMMGIFGWRLATLVMASGMSATIMLVTYFFLINAPRDREAALNHEELAPSHPEALGENQLAVRQNNAPGVNLSQRFGTQPTFWLIALGTGLLLGSDQALLASLIPYGRDRGFSTQEAAFLITAITGSAIAGKLLIGWLCERFDKRLLFSFVCGANIIFLFAALLSPSYGMLLMVCSFVGMAIGGVYPVWTSITAQSFGQESFAKVIGAMNLITVPMIVISIQIAGRAYDATGDYSRAFKIFLLQALLAAVLVWCVNAKRANGYLEDYKEPEG